MTPTEKHKKRQKVDPYNRIMEASKRGKGVKLSPEEVFQMSLDDAISTRAAHLIHSEEEA